METLFTIKLKVKEYMIKFGMILLYLKMIRK